MVKILFEESFIFKKIFLNVSLINLFILYLFLAVLGLRFCARAFSSCGERGPLFIAVRGPLTVAVSPVAEHKLQMRRLSSCGSRAQLLRGMWDLPRPGLEPVSPALASRFLTTVPTREALSFNIINKRENDSLSYIPTYLHFWCSSLLPADLSFHLLSFLFSLKNSLCLAFLVDVCW